LAKALAKKDRSTGSNGKYNVRYVRQNVKITGGEIDYLRKPMIVGGSTLDAALSDKALLIVQSCS
jgi:hypothetical protein